MKSSIVSLLVLVMTACSSSGKKVDSANSAPVSPASSVHEMTSEEIGNKYSIMQLNAAANLLKVVIDESGMKPSKDVGADLIGCPLTGAKAGSMAMPLKMQIDSAMHFETDSYVTDPKAYATEKGFETCAAECACGIMSDVVNGAQESALPATALRNHKRNLHALSVKASHQSPRDSLACARKTSWFCNSDLKTFLEKQSKENGTP